MLFKHPCDLPDFRQLGLKRLIVPPLKETPAKHGIAPRSEVPKQLLEVPGLGHPELGLRVGLDLLKRLVAQVLHAFEPRVFGALESIVLLLG